jgi:hypothetical protein
MQIRFREPWGEADSARPRTVKAGKNAKPPHNLLSK